MEETSQSTHSGTNFVLVCSAHDPAGCNIRDRLVEEFGFQETGKKYSSFPVYAFENIVIATSDKEIVFTEDLDDHFRDCDYVFLSRHRAESGIPSLTAHFTGNFGNEAPFGGRPREVSFCSPAFLKAYFSELVFLCEEKDELTNKKPYQLTVEATHHGPTSLKNPVMFVELGSSEENWSDHLAASTISKALVRAIHSERKKHSKVAIGLGGTHYPQKINKILLNSDVAVGHIVAKHSLEFLDQEMLSQILSKTDERVTAAVIDSKGLGSQKQRILQLLDEAGLETIKI